MIALKCFPPVFPHLSRHWPKAGNHPFIPLLFLTLPLTFKYTDPNQDCWVCVENIPRIRTLTSAITPSKLVQTFHLDLGNKLLLDFPASSLATYNLFSTAETVNFWICKYKRVLHYFLLLLIIKSILNLPVCKSLTQHTSYSSLLGLDVPRLVHSCLYSVPPKQKPILL